MARRGKLSRDQKRRQKLAREKKQEKVQPYEGSKYRSPEFTEALMKAEVGILESYVITGRQLTDRQVEKALEYLVLELRGEKPAAPPPGNYQARTEGEEFDDLVAQRIKTNWKDHFATRTWHSRADLAGILRTILSSVRVRSSPGPNARGYLVFLEKFLGKLGVRVDRVPPEPARQLELVPGGEVPSLTKPEETAPQTGNEPGSAAGAGEPPP
jgi:hypothetical protein